MQKLTIGFMNDALDSTNDVDLIVVNVLHRVLPSLKSVGYSDWRGEDSFVHDVLTPLLDIIFLFDPNLNHFWAKWIIHVVKTHDDLTYIPTVVSKLVRIKVY